jgi:hypothetical protein
MLHRLPWQGEEHPSPRTVHRVRIWAMTRDRLFYVFMYQLGVIFVRFAYFINRLRDVHRIENAFGKIAELGINL